MRTDWERLRETKIRPEIHKIMEKPGISEKDLCDLKMMLSVMEKSWTTQMFEEENEGESYANRSSYARRGGNRGYYDGPSYGGNSYANNSYYDGGYSGHDEKEAFRTQLHEMMRNSQNPETRHVIQEAIDKIR